MEKSAVKVKNVNTRPPCSLYHLSFVPVHSGVAVCSIRMQRVAQKYPRLPCQKAGWELTSTTANAEKPKPTNVFQVASLQWDKVPWSEEICQRPLKANLLLKLFFLPAWDILQTVKLLQ